MTGTDEHHALAFDLDSGSVWAVLGTYQQGVISAEEVSRLHHQMMDDRDTLTWDLECIMDGIRRSIIMATQRLGQVPDSIGVDTWGIDYGLLNAHGKLLHAPRAYRNRRMARWTVDLDRVLPVEAAWRETGILPQQVNAVYQPYANLRQEPDLIDQVDRFLPLPDLVAHLLGTPAQAERAIASTTRLASPGAREWLTRMLQATGIPEGWMPPLVDDTTMVGTTPGGITIVHPDGHDTACTVHAFGLAGDEVRLFISSGSWSLVGAAIPSPVLDAAVLRAGLTNEMRADGGIRLLCNLTGFWPLQECQRAWSEPNTSALVEATRDCASIGVVIDSDDELFASPGDTPAKIAQWYRSYYKVAPEGPAQTVRLILEPLTCAHAVYAQGLQGIVGDRLDPAAPIHLVGGGARDGLLPAITAAAYHHQVIVGMPKANTLGNILAQLEAADVLDPSTRGEVLRHSIDSVEVEASGTIADPDAFNAMRGRLGNATAD